MFFRVVTFALAVIVMSSSGIADPSYKKVETLLSTSRTNQGQAIAYPTQTPARVSSVIVTLEPGESTARHRHQVPLFAYILQGELRVNYEGHDTKKYKAGDALIEARDIWHQGTNTGSTPVRILAVFMGADGVKGTIVAK
ncbi:MAG: cupin domain-containing protein [Alphaproteobacteria bacterium]|nr:cupin domain-containing protein [Alphaproteobacteria bacterium]